MEPAALKTLLGVATLLPLLSFFTILVLGPRLGKAGIRAAHLATAAIVGAGLLSYLSLFIWVGEHGLASASHHGGEHHGGEHHEAEHDAHGADGHDAETHDAETHDAKGHDIEAAVPTSSGAVVVRGQEPAAGAEGEVAGDEAAADEAAADEAAEHHAEHASGKPYYTGVYYLLARAGDLRITISYYIDALTIGMFCMVTLIASCIHFYAMGYMHEELHEVTDHEVALRDGSHLHRPGRYHRFFQYLSLFCFSMLGLVLAGNIAMVFVFWELVGICSYFLIGFYIERKSASTAANKAFIVNRVGDFGMLIGLMIIWTGLGTFSFGDTVVEGPDGQQHVEQGLFSLVRSEDQVHVPDGLVLLAARDESAELVRQLPADMPMEEVNQYLIEQHVPRWRAENLGYGLLVVAGIGIFCGCIGKSAQFPLHTWLPDAMEGPTPVSALVHSATMVAAGVYLVGRFFPVFAPEVLLVIAVVGCITLFMAATIAITATDIKRVLAYSTISQLGYMMLALGVGGWLAGMLHLITHAFFKSLLFMCSGSVIHAVHTNEMPEMGGLRKKMPITAYTMLVGCLAIAGAGIPFVVGFSGYYSKDAILEQAFSFMRQKDNAPWGMFFFLAAAGGAAITAFYMFRLWYMTFAGRPRDIHRYEHAHESPKVMYVPLIILAVMATIAVLPTFNLSPLVMLLEQARPDNTLADVVGVMGAAGGVTWPDEHASHAWSIRLPVTLLAFGTALTGFAIATLMYGVGKMDPDEVRRQFNPIYRFLVNKWWFDELYDWLFVRPTHFVSRMISGFDRRWIDWAVDGSARLTRAFAVFWERIADQIVVDGLVNLVAGWTYAVGASFRGVQTGKLRQYVMFIVIGAVALFVVISFFWSPTLAG